MSKLKRHEEIKFALFGINSMHTAALKGFYSEEEAKTIAIRHWENFKLTKEEVFAYFGKKEYRNESKEKIGIQILDDPTPQWVHNEMAEEQWKALEYFELI